MPLRNLLEYSENYAKTSASLWQYCRDGPDDNIRESKFFKFKSNITDNTNNAGIANVKIVVPLKCLSKFWKTLEIPLINCEVTFHLNWSENLVICEVNRPTTFAMSGAKLYVPVVTFSTRDNAKLLQQLKSGFKRTISWNKYQSKTSTEARNQYLDFLIRPSSQGVNRLFVLPFENQGDRTGHTVFYLPKVEIKDYNVKIDGRNFFD